MMEFETFGEEERKILLQVLDVSVNDLKCRYCSEKVEVKSCGIMPPLKDEKAIITCNSPLCVTTYLIDLEEIEKQKVDMGGVFIKHIGNHLLGGQEVICKICEKNVEAIYAEEREKGDKNGN